MRPIRAIALSFTADFEPEGVDDDLVTWTFLVPKASAEIGAGIFELRLIRVLTPDERDQPVAAVLSREAA